MNAQIDAGKVIEKGKQVRMAVFDFDGVFTDNRVLIFPDGTEGVFCSRSDGIGLSKLKGLGIKLLVLSTEPNPIVAVRCKKLDIPCIHGCDDKEEQLKSVSLQQGIPLSRIAYVGNDTNDLGCLRMVGFPACVADAFPGVTSESIYITEARGGYGAVREFCDFIAGLAAGENKE